LVGELPALSNRRNPQLSLRKNGGLHGSAILQQTQILEIEGAEGAESRIYAIRSNKTR